MIQISLSRTSFYIKVFFYTFFLSYTTIIAKAEKKPCEVSLTSDWKELDTSKKFSSHWVMVGTLSIKKRMEHSLRLDSMLFAWHGPRITAIDCSLFRIPFAKNTIFATDENLIAQGIWSVSAQRMHFPFFHPEYIHDPIARYALVMTFDEKTGNMLKEGYFEIVPDNLPDQLKKIMLQRPLRLSFAQPAQPSSKK